MGNFENSPLYLQFAQTTLYFYPFLHIIRNIFEIYFSLDVFIVNKSQSNNTAQ